MIENKAYVNAMSQKETMPALNLLLVVASMVILFMAKPSLEQEIFNPMDYEAMGDGETDDALALVDAWDAACQHHKPSIYLIPKKTTFLAGPTTLDGPCRVTPVVRIEGTIKALEDMEKFINPGWIEFKHLDGLRISGGGTIDGQGASSWGKTSCRGRRGCKNRPISLRFLKVTNTSLTNVELVNSKGFHMSIQQSSAVTVSNLKITAPEESPNTDGIHISGSDHVRITGLTIGTGDDCISIGQGSTNVLIDKVVCGPGHGISIGSLGKYKDEADVVGVTVRNCSLTGTTNGVRIKSWPGSPPSRAQNLTFANVVMRNVSNAVFIDQKYCPTHNCADVPSRVKIEHVEFRGIRGTTRGAVAVKLVCSKSAPCENVHMKNINLVQANNKTTTETLAVCTNVKGTAARMRHPASCIV